MSKKKTIKIHKEEMLLDDWEKAKNKACKAFVSEWNKRMPCRLNHLKAKQVEREIDDFLWDDFSDEVLR